MENRHENLISALNDLVKINNNRTERYKKAILLTDNGELKSIFHDMALQSSKNIDDLIDRIFRLDSYDISEGTNHEGEIYRGWMALKDSIEGKDEYSLLTGCEAEEDQTLKSYNNILQNKIDYELDYEIEQLLKNQIEKLESEHEKIIKMRDDLTRD